MVRIWDAGWRGVRSAEFVYTSEKTALSCAAISLARAANNYIRYQQSDT